MSTRKSLRSTARAVTSPITAIGSARAGSSPPRPRGEGRGSGTPRATRRCRRRAGSTGSPRPPPRPSPRGRSGRQRRSPPLPLPARWRRQGISLPSSARGRRNRFPPNPAGRSASKSPSAVCFSAVRCTGTDLDASSFVVPGPTLATRRVPGQEPTRAGPRARRRTAPRWRSRRGSSRRRRDDRFSRSKRAAILGMRKLGSWEEDRNAAGAAKQGGQFAGLLHAACDEDPFPRERHPFTNRTAGTPRRGSPCRPATGAPRPARLRPPPGRDGSAPGSAQDPRSVGLPISPRGATASPSTVPCAAMGTWHPPSSRFRKPRSARTARDVVRSSRNATASRVSFVALRISIPSAPLPDRRDGNVGGDILADLAVPPSRREGPRRRGGSRRTAPLHLPDARESRFPRQLIDR